MSPAAATPFTPTALPATVGIDGSIPTSAGGVFGAELATILATPPAAVIPVQAVAPPVPPTPPAPPLAAGSSAVPAAPVPPDVADLAPATPTKGASPAPDLLPAELEPRPVAGTPTTCAPSRPPSPANGKAAPLPAAEPSPGAPPLAPAAAAPASSMAEHAIVEPTRGIDAPVKLLSIEPAQEREVESTPVEVPCAPADLRQPPQSVPAFEPPVPAPAPLPQADGTGPAQAKAVAIAVSGRASTAPADMRAPPEPPVARDATAATAPLLEVPAPASSSAPDFAPVSVPDAPAPAREVERAPSPSAPTEPTVAARPGQAGRELGLEIARVGREGGDELVVRLDPAELGRVEVRLAWDEGVLAATVRTEHPAAMELFRREVADLGRALGEAGVRADTAAFRFEGGGRDGRQPPPEWRGGVRASTERETPSPSTLAAPEVKLARGRIDLIA